jgi:hypothetical protein
MAKMMAGGCVSIRSSERRMLSKIRLAMRASLSFRAALMRARVCTASSTIPGKPPDGLSVPWSPRAGPGERGSKDNNPKDDRARSFSHRLQKRPAPGPRAVGNDHVGLPALPMESGRNFAPGLADVPAFVGGLGDRIAGPPGRRQFCLVPSAPAREERQTRAGHLCQFLSLLSKAFPAAQVRRQVRPEGG